MSHSLVYIIPFKSLRNDAFEIQILKENHLGGSPIELIGGADPLVISMEDEDFLYTPIRKSSAKITIVGSDYLQALYSNNYHEWKVNIYRSNTLIWTGFINPEAYTQDYVNETIELTIEASSALSVLENIEYKTEKKEWITIFTYFKKIIQASKGDYKGVIIPSTYQRDENNIFENLQLSESNFFDEDGEPMMLLETVEELCKFFNWTITDYNGYLTFVDIDYAGEYRIYDLELINYTAITPSIYKVQDIGFNGGNNTLDILPGYTKASVKVSNYNVKELLPEPDYDELDVIKKEGASDGYKRNTIWQFLKPYKHYKIFHYKNDLTEMSEEEFEKSDKISYNLGSSLVNCFNYQGNNSTTRPEYKETSIKYKPAILVRAKTAVYGSLDDTFYKLKDQPVLHIKGDDILLFTPGAICLKLEVETLTLHYRQENKNALLATDTTNGMEGLDVRFRLGEYYWNGSRWVTDETNFKLPLDRSNTTGFMQLESNKKLFEGPNKADGYILDLWSRTTPKSIKGDWEFIIYTSRKYFDWVFTDTEGYHIGNLSIKFEPMNGKDLRESKGDRIYENVINESLVNELDEIEFKINSHNNDGISHSKILLDGYYLTDNLYSRLADKTVRPEEQLITRIVNQYDNAKVKLTQELEFKEIRVIDLLTDSYLKDKQFSITGIEYSAAESRMKISMIENG